MQVLNHLGTSLIRLVKAVMVTINLKISYLKPTPVLSESYTQQFIWHGNAKTDFQEKWLTTQSTMSKSCQRGFFLRVSVHFILHSWERKKEHLCVSNSCRMWELNNLVGAFYEKEKGNWEYGAGWLSLLLTMCADSNFKFLEHLKKKERKDLCGESEWVMLHSLNNYYECAAEKDNETTCMNVCKLSAAVVIYAFSQLALLQQSQNIDFHIGSLCDMKTEIISLQ